MNASCITLLKFSKIFDISIFNYNRYYSKKVSSTVGSSSITGRGKVGKFSPTATKVKLEVETDPVRLSEYCCGSCFYREGEDVKLKTDNEYPEWLWKLNLGPPPKLDELDPNTLEYWHKVRYLYKKRAFTILKAIHR